MEETVALTRNHYLNELGYLKIHSDAYGLEIIPRSQFCRHSRMLADIHRTEDLPDNWPPPQCEHPYCRFKSCVILNILYAGFQICRPLWRRTMNPFPKILPVGIVIIVAIWPLFSHNEPEPDNRL
ncbi:hypothetical protein ELB75_10670 [Eikenella corrodens]|uniref:Uncharacterized protein n=1 Tax=Eikenella corrodens TaxID=539 RepID=A0A3S9SLM4_EIKCO|nr:hypothetical protein ELB75_10670 [Eikenella corrodens]